MSFRNDLLPLIGRSILSISSITSLLIYLTGKDSLKKYDWLNRLPGWLRAVVICSMLGILVAVVASFGTKEEESAKVVEGAEAEESTRAEDGAVTHYNTGIQLQDSSRAGERLAQDKGLPKKLAAGTPAGDRGPAAEDKGQPSKPTAVMKSSTVANREERSPARTRFNGVIINIQVNNEPDDDLSGILADIYQGAGISALTGLHPNLDAATAITGHLTIAKAPDEKPPAGIDAIPYRAQLAIQLYSGDSNTPCNTLTYKTEFYLAPGYTLPVLIKRQFQILINRFRAMHPLPQCPGI